MAHIFGVIVVYALFAWAYISFIITVIILVTNFEGEDVFGVPVNFFLLPAFWCLVFFLMPGFEKALFFIPADWMSEGDGGWYSSRGTYAGILAFFASVGIALFFVKYAEMRNKLERTKNELEAKKKKRNKINY
ncbi:MAG: hypothetical protein WCI36_03750 [bacterium]